MTGALAITAAVLALNVLLGAWLGEDSGTILPSLLWIVLAAGAQWVLFAERVFPDIRERRAMMSRRWGLSLGFAMQEPFSLPTLRQRLDPGLSLRVAAVGALAVFLLLLDSPLRGVLWSAPFWVICSALFLAGAYIPPRLPGAVLLSLVHLWRTASLGEGSSSSRMLLAMAISAIEVGAFLWWLNSFTWQRTLGARFPGTWRKPVLLLTALSIAFFYLLPKQGRPTKTSAPKVGLRTQQIPSGSRLGRGGGEGKPGQDRSGESGSQSGGASQGSGAQGKGAGGQSGQGGQGPEGNHEPREGGEARADSEAQENSERGKNGESGDARNEQGGTEGTPDRQGEPESGEGDGPASPSRRRPMPPWRLPKLPPLLIFALAALSLISVYQWLKRRKRKQPPPLRARAHLSEREKEGALDRLRAHCRRLAGEDADASTRRERVIALYNFLLQFLEDCGRGKPSHVTPDEFSEHVAAQSLNRVTRTFSRACYGGEAPSREAFHEYVQAVPRLAEDLSRP